MHHRHSSPAAAPALKVKTLAFAIAASFASIAVANPVGPAVVAGSASFAANGNTLTVVNTPGTIINWQQFNIGQSEITKFIQQSNQSTVLNRIGGQDPSQILGTLQSNGRVFLVNPNGILFGQNAVIDVFGLVASNLNLANADFLAGRFNFNGGGVGAVVNQGTITTPVGGSVYLVGSSVTNQGLITSPQGDVLLAAGNSASLADTGAPNVSVTLNASDNKAVNLGRITADGGRIDIYGALIDQQGVLRADSASVDAQGRIVLRATQNADVAGELTVANSVGNGGSVQVLGDNVTLASTARIDASGATGGGTVLIGGDRQGGNAAVPNARNTSLAAGATVNADATSTGNGGTVVVWSSGKTIYDGFISARGGANGGDGGFVETSGHTLSLGGRADTTAAKGKTGNWLLDPASYCFYLSTSSECSSTGFNASNGTSIDIFNSLLMSSDVTMNATDYAVFLPAGGTFIGSSSVPSGRTLTIQAPYLYSNGNIDTGDVKLVLDASSQYGTSSFSGKTGVIDIPGGVIQSSVNQTVTATSDINIGSAASTSVTGLYVTGSSAATQSVSAGGNLNVISGSGDTSTGAPIQSYIYSSGSQSVSGANITLTAGSGSGIPGTNASGSPYHNNAHITAFGQTQTITSPGTISVNGGAAGAFNEAGFVLFGSGAQTIHANRLDLNGGASGTSNYGFILASSTGTAGSQTITANTVALAGGGAGTGNYAFVNATGTQTVTADDLKLAGGNGGTNNYAILNANNSSVTGTQTITANRLVLTAGTAGAGNYALINNYGNQLIALNGTGSRLALTGGGSGSSDYDDYALIVNNTGSQSITINGGGSVILQGGAGSGTTSSTTIDSKCSSASPCTASRNAAVIKNEGTGAQTLDFVSGGTLTLTGGTNGSANWAEIESRGSQTITSSGGAPNYPTIALTGGSGGYYDSAKDLHIYNSAEISTDTTSSSQRIDASSIVLNGGGTATTRGGAAIDGDSSSTITVTGSVTVNGGNSSAGETSFRIGQVDTNAEVLGDVGSTAYFGHEGGLTLTIGGDLTLEGGSGTSAPAFIGALRSLSVGGTTNISASASPALIAGMAILSETYTLASGDVVIASSSTAPLQTGALMADGNRIKVSGPITATRSVELYGETVDVNAPITAGSYFASVGGTFNLGNAIIANGSTYNSYFGAAASSSGKYLQTGIWTSRGFSNKGGSIQTPNGYWVVVLDPEATGTTNAIGSGPLTSSELLAAGYHFASAAAEASSSSSSLRFYAPVSSAVQQVAAQVAADTCAANPALCASSQQQQTTAAAIAATAESSAAKDLTVEEKPKTAETTEETKVAEEKKESDGKKQGEQKRAEVAKQKQDAKAAEERKSSAELKQEAKQAQAEAKQRDTEAKQARAEAKKVEGEAKQAASVAKKAEAEAKKAEAEVKKAEAEVKAAKTPERKAVAEAKKAEAESKIAAADSKKGEAEAKHAQAESKHVEAEAKQAARDAKQAEAERKLALAEAKEAKTPEAKGAAQSKAADKQVEATRKQAEGEVKQAKAEEHKVAAAQKKAEGEAKQAEHDAKRAESGAKQAEADAARAKQAGKPDDEKKALAQKAEFDKQAEASQKQAEAKQAEAGAKKAEHQKMAEERRSTAAKAFARAALGAMAPDRLAQNAVLRHEFKGELFKAALNILDQNPKAADMPTCGAGGGDVCVPTKAAADAAGRQAAQFAAALPKPTLSFVPQIERKVAILVGINQYADKRIPSLDSAVPDVEAMARTMQEKLGYEVRIVRDAGKADIVRAINGIGKEVGPNDSVAIYYAGHGYLNEKTNTGYWIPADGSVADPANWISNNDIARLLQQIPAKQLMLVSDSCYSGSLTREGKVAATASSLDDILGKRSVTVMSSGGEEPVSDEGREGHSIFAWSLMESLKKVDRYESGAKIFDNVKRGVVEEFPQVPQYGAATSAGHAGGDYLLEVRSYK